MTIAHYEAPPPLRGKPDEVAAVILAGGELGLRPMAALRIVVYIQGTPAFKAEGLRAMIVGHGHELWFDESTVTRAIAAGRRAGEERISRVTYTMDDAKRAGVAGRPNYRSYPAEMLRARASSALARMIFPDVLGGLFAEEELDAASENGAPIPPPTPPPPPPQDAEPPEKPTRTRKRAQTREAVAPTPPPDPQPEPEPPTEPLATDPMKKRIFASMRDQGFTDRTNRLAYVSRIVGRPVESSNDLTISEASKLIDALEHGTDSAREPPPNPDATEETTDSEERLTRLMDRLDQHVIDGLEQRTITIHDLWAVIAAFRHKLVDDLIAELAGRPEGQLLWQPLRDNLRADEAGDLLTHLNAQQRQLAPDDIPF